MYAFENLHYINSSIPNNVYCGNLQKTMHLGKNKFTWYTDCSSTNKKTTYENINSFDIIKYSLTDNNALWENRFTSHIGMFFN